MRLLSEKSLEIKSKSYLLRTYTVFNPFLYLPILNALQGR